MPTDAETFSAAELRRFLNILLAERAEVKLGVGGGRLPDHAELDREIADMHRAYVAAAVTEIAAFRASFSPRNWG